MPIGVGTQFAEGRDAVANAVGFRIDSISLTGQKQLTREEILAVAGVTGRSSLLFLDADDARRRLKANPWIADATVLKLFPDRLHIAITERRAFALWQKEGRVRVVARDGVVVEPFVAPHVAHLPLVVGKGAECQGLPNFSPDGPLSAICRSRSTPTCWSPSDAGICG